VSTSILAESGYSLARIAEACHVSEHSARKYLYGERAISMRARHEFLRDGEQGKKLVSLLDAKRRAYEENYPCVPGSRKRLRKRADVKPTTTQSRVMRDAPNPPARDYSPAEPHYTIEEWKERFGLPGDSRPDGNGRVWGYFPTEPCYCE
jgi:hypothetical protein